MSAPAPAPLTPPPASLPTAGRVTVLLVAFLGWLGAGVHMSITQQTGRAAAIDLLGRTGEIDADRFQALSKQDELAKKGKGVALTEADAAQVKAWEGPVGRWFAWNQCAFLFGAAAGGLLFGWLGDRVGRAKGMAFSILTYSAFASGVAFAQAPWQFAALWFLACTGVGGMWPNGVALVSEAWSSVSRPALAGVIGTSANIGIFLFATLARMEPITPNHWRWAMFVGAVPLALGVFALLAVPESPRWLAARGATPESPTAAVSTGDVFKPPLLWVTLTGIVLATTPVIGGWGIANWMTPWAEKEGSAALRAEVGQTRALTGIVGSLLGGWIASQLGRRKTYFLVSVVSLLIAQYVFRFLVPLDRSFLVWVGVLGFVSGVYFGWLPLCLPELFPTRVRSTGAGVSFNFGRIATAVTLFASGALMHLFGGDYALIGRITSLFFVLGIVAILFAPDTSKKQITD
jgi:MFS transporter, SHS family, sialic acid transporter